jgi:type IV pilus assembly protein PilN
MRVNINLASQPYEDLRRFLLRWGLLLALVVAITIGVVSAAVTGWLRARDVNAQIAHERDAMEKTDREIGSAQRILEQPGNRTVRLQSQFLNELIARKAFSWTRVFTDLERMMPAHLHVVSIKPELDDENRLQIKMNVAGNSGAAAIELLRRMEESQRFVNPELTNQTVQQNGVMNFEITSLYAPQGEAGETPAARGATQGGQ